MFESLVASIDNAFSDLAPSGAVLGCAKSFFEGFVVGVGVGFLTVLALSALASVAAPLAIVAAAALAVAGVVGLWQLSQDWPAMSPQAKSFALGNMLGGLVGGELGPPELPSSVTLPGFRSIVTTEGVTVLVPQPVVVAVPVTVANAGAGVAAGSAVAAMSGGGGGDSGNKAGAKYTDQSDKHVREHGHADDGQPLMVDQKASKIAGQTQYKSKFGLGEGGQSFTDEVINDSNTTRVVQNNGNIRYTNQDLGRATGTGRDGTPVRGGEVIVNGTTNEVVTQYPAGNLGAASLP